MTRGSSTVHSEEVNCQLTAECITECSVDYQEQYTAADDPKRWVILFYPLLCVYATNLHQGNDITSDHHDNMSHLAHDQWYKDSQGEVGEDYPKRDTG